MKASHEHLKHLQSLFETAVQHGVSAYMDADAYQLLVDSYMDCGEYTKARQACNMALDMHPYSAELVITSGNLFQLNGDLEQALEQVEKGLSIDPYNGEGWLLKTVLTLDAEDVNGLLQDLEHAAHASNEPDMILVAKGMVLEKRGLIQKAINTFSQVLTNNPSNELAWHHLAEVVVKHDKVAKTLPFVQQLADREPFNFAGWYYLGQLLNHNKQYTEAIQSFEYCTAIDDTQDEAWLMLASAQMNARLFEEAKLSLKRVLEINPEHLEGQLYMAASHEQLGSYEEAMRWYRQVLDIAPQFPDAWYGLGTCLLSNEQNFNAIHHIAKAIQLDGSKGNYWFSLAEAEYRMGNVISADEAYEQACDLDPDNAQVYLNWSFVYYENGDYERAISLITSGIEEIPDNAELYYRAVVYLLSQGSVREGFLYLQKALLLDFDKHTLLFEFFKELETQKALFKIIDQYRNG